MAPEILHVVSFPVVQEAIGSSIVRHDDVMFISHNKMNDDDQLTNRPNICVRVASWTQKGQ